MKVKPIEFKKAIQKFTGKLQADERYASFDYCYSYFNSFKDKREIASATNLQSSCMALGFYLASWGMFRASAFVFQRSARHFVPLVKWISSCDADLWKIDVPDYATPGTRKQLLGAYQAIHERLSSENKKPTKTLTTKVMLGVFGNIPAFDQYFCRSLGTWTVSDRSLLRLYDFYMTNQPLIDNFDIKCHNFNTGKQSGPRYTKAKIIDMYGFITRAEKE